jgi:hypothetical protein
VLGLHSLSNELRSAQFRDKGVNKNIVEQLPAALSETARLRSENELLRIRDSCPQVVLAWEMDAKALIASCFSSDEKGAL